MNSTALSTLLSRMNRNAPLLNTEELDKVKDLDEAIRRLRRLYKFPWTLKKSSLKIFKDVLEYPIASDHNRLAFLDNPKYTSIYEDTPRFRFTSYKEFLENPDYRNDIAEIWDNGTMYLGVRYNRADMNSVELSNAETASYYTASDDATAVALDSVYYKEGNGSIKVSITNSTGTATIKNTFTSQSNTDYKKDYHFRWIYLDAVPTSIEMRLQTDDSNYLSSGAITTQFSGQAFKADQWNLIAYDLNTATATGTFNSASIASEKMILTGASSGEYYLDTSYMKQWEPMDYYYYTKYNVKTVTATVPDQEYFILADVYSTDSELVCDSEFADVVMYEAMLSSLSEKENASLYAIVKGKRDEAWEAVMRQYPTEEPMTTTSRWRFITDHLTQQTYDRYDE